MVYASTLDAGQTDTKILSLREDKVAGRKGGRDFNELWKDGQLGMRAELKRLNDKTRRHYPTALSW